MTTDTIGMLLVASAVALYLLVTLVKARRRRDMEALMAMEHQLSEEDFRRMLRTMMLEPGSDETDIAIEMEVATNAD